MYNGWEVTLLCAQWSNPLLTCTWTLFLSFFFAPPEKKIIIIYVQQLPSILRRGKKMKGSRVITYPINIGQRHTNTPRLAWNPFFLVVCPPFHFISGSCFYDDSGVYVHSRAFFSLSLSLLAVKEMCLNYCHFSSINCRKGKNRSFKLAKRTQNFLHLFRRLACCKHWNLEVFSLVQCVRLCEYIIIAIRGQFCIYRAVTHDMI